MGRKDTPLETSNSPSADDLDKVYAEVQAAAATETKPVETAPAGEVHVDGPETRYAVQQARVCQLCGRESRDPQRCDSCGVRIDHDGPGVPDRVGDPEKITKIGGHDLDTILKVLSEHAQR